MLSFAAGQAGGLLASLLALTLVALRAAVPDPTHRAELRNAIALFVASAASYAGAQVLDVASFQDAARYVRSASYLFCIRRGAGRDLPRGLAPAHPPREGHAAHPA